MGKREQQRKIKQQKQEVAKKRAQAKKLALKICTFVLAPIFLFFALYVFLTQGPTYSPIEIAENDHIKGPAGNPVTIVVYADFQCPACAIEHQAMRLVWPSIQDKAKLVFRHYPITNTNPHSWTASLYAEAAGGQDGFWGMHDYLFDRQSIWSGMQTVDEEFDSYALELNLDIDQLHIDMASDEVIRKIRNDQRGGNSAGVRATPAVFINGRQLNNPSRARILELVNQEYMTEGD
ncbi:MAG: hypothetical protein CMQ41_11940 [Gammaproteobacteria bacterium]|nr:hypothetical protein [Gammaproteobacteria bacterium]